tara:strand:+ start:1903 stop:2109 length:207 start_codon:yes stop_codon:yes gene_type:complete
MKYDIFYPLFRNIVRLRKLSLERYNWNIEMKVLELNCEIDTFIKYINKKNKHIEIMNNFKQSQDNLKK